MTEIHDEAKNFGWTVQRGEDGVLELRSPARRRGMARKSQNGLTLILGVIATVSFLAFIWNAVVERRLLVNALALGCGVSAIAAFNQAASIRIIVTTGRIELIREAFGIRLGAEQRLGKALACEIPDTGAAELRFDDDGGASGIYIDDMGSVRKLAQMINAAKELG
ncbi:MAG: hypothetical protein ACO1SX_16620 [Actinomycetota bacterium]